MMQSTKEKSRITKNILKGYHKEYEVLEKLGEGAYGYVLKVRCRLSEQVYAMKIILNTRDEKKVLQEVPILASLDNPHTVRFYHSFLTNLENNMADMVLSSESTSSKLLCILMELCDSTLKDWLRQRNVQPTADGSSTVVNLNVNLKMLRNILKGLVYLHAQNIIHRDLKPANIFLKMGFPEDAEPVVKIGDFGLSRHMDQSTGDVMATPAPGNSRNGPELTAGVGTWLYSAPELLSSRNYDQKADIYSFALIMYEMFQPFSSDEERRSALLKLRDGDQICSYIKKAWPDQIIYIKRLLNKEPNQRPTAKKLLETPLFRSQKQQLVRDQESTIKKKDNTIKFQLAEIARLRGELNEKPNNPANVQLCNDSVDLSGSTDDLVYHNMDYTTIWP